MIHSKWEAEKWGLRCGHWQTPCTLRSAPQGSGEGVLARRRGGVGLGMVGLGGQPESLLSCLQCPSMPSSLLGVTEPRLVHSPGFEFKTPYLFFSGSPTAARNATRTYPHDEHQSRHFRKAWRRPPPERRTRRNTAGARHNRRLAVGLHHCGARPSRFVCASGLHHCITRFQKQQTHQAADSLYACCMPAWLLKWPGCIHTAGAWRCWPSPVQCMAGCRCVRSFKPSRIVRTCTKSSR